MTKSTEKLFTNTSSTSFIVIKIHRPKSYKKSLGALKRGDPKRGLRILEDLESLRKEELSKILLPVSVNRKKFHRKKPMYCCKRELHRSRWTNNLASEFFSLTKHT
ncbi:hypothetical protein ILYODFUR_024571 [Ilyodon furcidens]|uniref:Uncharacterized protein n=1 Tax=Ilyodon furcidens TaxID=33524 RepID=A0ABV0TB52_9TELE